jgi:hypothetical protein
MIKQLKEFILYPIIIYAVISVEITAIVVLGHNSDAPWVWMLTTPLATLLIGFFAYVAKPVNLKAGLKMGCVWATVFFVLDFLIVAVPFTGIAYFLDIRSWIAYLISIIILSIAGKLHQKN